MGNSNIIGILNGILENKINNLKKDTIYVENVNFQAFNIYFEVENIKYQLAIELDSGCDIYLKYQNGYSKNGDLLFEPDPIMLNLDFQKEIHEIRKTTKFDYLLRLKLMVGLVCDKINDKKQINSCFKV